jgi:phosphoenolpyruvate phosphomutase / 2-hydroxyethylphosphonate cytidylyltransferase
MAEKDVRTIMEKRVYLALSTDPVHPGNLHLISEARKRGTVIVGLLTDEAIAGYRRIPFLTYDQRRAIAENIKGVSEVIPQASPDVTENLERIRPDYVIHGADGKAGVLSPAREAVIALLQQWGGELIEVDTSDISSIPLQEHHKTSGITPQMRIRQLRRIIGAKNFVRALEAHNGLTGLIVERTAIESSEGRKEFDAIWLGSLADSTAKGKPDIECVDMTSRIATLNEILEVTTKPIMVDMGTGGLAEHFAYATRTLERLGVSAVIIEDKTGLKRNSLHKDSKHQYRETVENFCHKIAMGRKCRITDDFMIIARIESFICGAGLEDALDRALAYIEAGADGIMIHSNKPGPEEILSFCARYQSFSKKVPLVAVPSTYTSTREKELRDSGITVVIYANQLIRSAYPAMVRTAQSILEHERAEESESSCLPVQEILHLIPGIHDD